MKTVLFQGKTPTQVEGFPTDVERSVDGALHFKPGESKELSDDEYAWLQANRPDLKKQVVLLRSN